MSLRLHISPCPNDTFMFAAPAQAMPSASTPGGLIFETFFYDIEELNHLCIKGIPDVSKISYAALPAVIENYELLDCGSALGRGNGPVFVRGKNKKIQTVAIPGIHTTANRLLEIFYPELKDKTPMLFSEIAPAVARGAFDAGVLIHEGRFVYERLGLELVADLGELWAGGPLPLGGIVVRRSLPTRVKHSIETALRESIAHALAHPEASRAFVRKHAQEMDDAVVEAHIRTFVNEYSLTLGGEGRRAVERFTGLKIWK